MLRLFDMLGRSAAMRALEDALRESGVHPLLVPDPVKLAHSDTSDQVFRRHMISHSGVSDHPEMTPSGAVW